MKFLLPLLLLFSVLTGKAQIHEYYFNNTFSGTGGGGTLTEALACSAQPGAFGTDSIKTDNGLCSVADVFCFNAGGGVSYPNNNVTGSYSINLLFKFNTLSGYSRIIDFSNSTSDYGFYLLGNCLNFYPNGNVGACIFQAGVYYLFTFVRDGNTNIISVYVNGVLFASYTDTGNNYKPATTTTPIIFFRDDNPVPCEAKSGCVKYASISQQLLTGTQVDSIYQDICNISLPPCNAAINYPGNPYSTALATAQPVTLTGNTGGTFTSTSGLSINSTTGDINPSASTPGTYTVTYAVADSGVCSNYSTTASVTITAPVNNTCSANGNMIVFTNYDGGTLNINVDVNIPNLKIGVVSYEPVQINLTGAFASNVTRLIRAGFPNTTNQHCTPNVSTTAINGPVPANYSIYDIPPSTLNNPNGYNFGIICAYSCNSAVSQGGCNTIDQILDYFNNQFTGSTLYSLNAQYCCWKPTNTYLVSALSNSCCVSTTPSATISYSGTPFCNSVSTAQPVTFSGSQGGTFSAPVGLSINSTTGEINPSLSTAGTYTVTYSIAGCPDYTTTTNVSVVTSATATISYPAATFCTGAATQQVTLTGTGGGTYTSTNGLSIDANTGSINPANSTAGNYTVTYTLASGNCTGATATTQVAISPAVTETFSYSMCPGANYTFAGQTLTAAGQYSDTSTAVGGCDSITTLNLTVTDTPASAITTTSNMFCPGDSIEICAPQNLTSYLWNTGGTGNCMFAKNAGNYYVTVTDANSCTAESNHLSLSTYQVPSVSVSVSGDTLSVYGADNYQWFYQGNLIPDAQGSVYVATQNGNYQVQVTDSNGCKATSNDIQVTITGINNVAIQTPIKLYPNPTENGIWNLECPLEIIGQTLEVFDAGGRLVYKTEIRGQKSEIGFNAAKGIYSLRINTNSGVIVQKLVHL